MLRLLLHTVETVITYCQFFKSVESARVTTSYTKSGESFNGKLSSLKKITLSLGKPLTNQDHHKIVYHINNELLNHLITLL